MSDITLAQGNITELPDKIRVIFADDEQPARDKLAHQLSLIPDIELVGLSLIHI